MLCDSCVIPVTEADSSSSEITELWLLTHALFISHPRERERDRETERKRGKERVRKRDRERDRERERETETARERERDRQRETEIDKMLVGRKNKEERTVMMMERVCALV